MAIERSRATFVRLIAVSLFASSLGVHIVHTEAPSSSPAATARVRATTVNRLEARRVE